MTEGKRCCENCGRTECANSVIAFLWDLCVEDNFTKYWKQKEKDGEQDGN